MKTDKWVGRNPAQEGIDAARADVAQGEWESAKARVLDAIDKGHLVKQVDIDTYNERRLISHVQLTTITNNTRLTMALINSKLREMYGADVEFIKGKGYFYFVDERDGRFGTESEIVYRLNHLTLAEWIERAVNYFDREIDDLPPENIHKV